MATMRDSEDMHNDLRRIRNHLEEVGIIEEREHDGVMCMKVWLQGLQKEITKLESKNDFLLKACERWSEHYSDMKDRFERAEKANRELSVLKKVKDSE
jgi:hypothetical protein